MPEELENFRVTLNLPLHLILNLRLHQHKLLLNLNQIHTTPDPRKLSPRLLNLPIPDQLTRRVRHKSSKAHEHNHAPGDLDSQRETPLHRAVGGIATRETDPIRHHGAEGDAAAGDTADEAAVAWVGDLAEVDGYCGDHPAGGDRVSGSDLGVESWLWTWLTRLHSRLARGRRGTCRY